MNIGIIDKRSIWVEGIFYLLKSNFKNYNIYRFEEYDELGHILMGRDLDIVICSNDYIEKNKKIIKRSNVESIIVFSDIENTTKDDNIIYINESINKNEFIRLVSKIESSENTPVYNNVKLSEREYNLLYLLSLGYSNKEIGKKIFLSEKTIKNNLTEMYKKLGIRNRYDAIKFYESKNKIDEIDSLEMYK
ncbi:MAG: response regulator transcription factor [Tissierellia bacterium]|nr:response regulator transcription factor [Tissierellia bacterium]